MKRLATSALLLVLMGATWATEKETTAPVSQLAISSIHEAPSTTAVAEDRRLAGVGFGDPTSAPAAAIGEPLECKSPCIVDGAIQGNGVSLSLPDTATVVSGKASWYCGAGSRCTSGYPASGLYAAAGPALRVGDWRGRIVTVRSGTKTVRVRLVDWCFCGGGRVVDLYRSAFSRLAPPSRGVIRVAVSWGNGAVATLPPTSTTESEGAP